MDTESTDPREPVPGPGDTKLTPAGNSDARFLVPDDQEEESEESEERDPGEPEDHAAAEDEDSES